MAISKQTKRKSAFTLIEIMVATVIMVVLVGLVVQITSEVLRVWNRSSGKLSANADARIALQLLTADLETAMFRNDGSLWLESEKQVIPSIAGYDPQTVSLILFAPAADRPLEDDNNDAIAGDICAIQYALASQNAVTGSDGVQQDNTFALHRRVIDSATTFTNLMGSTTQKSFDAWKSSSVSVANGIALPEYPVIEEPDNYLVGNIANFELKFYVINDQGEEELVNIPAVRYGGTNPTVGLGAQNSDYRNSLAYAELAITVISDEGAKLLQSLAAGRGGTGYTSGDEIVKQHGEVYTRRINFIQPL